MLPLMLVGRDVKIEYVTLYYDYARAGHCKYGDERYYFLESETEDLYSLFELTAKEWDYEDRCTEAFKKHVSTMWTYIDGRRTHEGVVHPISEHSKFYDDPEWQGSRSREDYETKPVRYTWDRFDRYSEGVPNV